MRPACPLCAARAALYGMRLEASNRIHVIHQTEQAGLHALPSEPVSQTHIRGCDSMPSNSTSTYICQFHCVRIDLHRSGRERVGWLGEAGDLEQSSSFQHLLWLGLQPFVFQAKGGSCTRVENREEGDPVGLTLTRTTAITAGLPTIRVSTPDR